MGIIPARAGFTRPPLQPPFVRADHPRSRGVYCHTTASRLLRCGSSPLARGLLRGKTIEIRDVGIIPARAGFTFYMTHENFRDADHPRSRGVYDAVGGLASGVAGSSPLARGLHDGTRWDGTSGRIIPARAGFTGRPFGRSAWGADHPRSRGVYPLCVVGVISLLGSSPLARGLPYHQSPREALRRIIPARAGFT